ncbi:MAG: glycosyltransferase family 4 protein [Phycisphaerales bacterium]|nr:glycosyltransferase family 4 protein [Phycisphaerales bacterium]
MSREKIKRVAVISHLYAHYREALFNEMIKNSPYRYEFLGCKNGFGTGIALLDHFPDNRFVKTKGWMLGPLFIQPAAITAALSSKYDTLILTGNMMWPTMWAAAIIGRVRGKRVLMWTHGWLREESGLKRRFRDIFYRLAHGLLLYNNRAKEIGIAHGFDPDRMYVIYNSLDADTQRSVRDSIDSERIETIRNEYFPGRAHYPVLATVTRLMPDKRIDMLINAAEILERNGFPVNILIVGSGPEEKNLRDQAESKGVAVHFSGAVYDEHTLGEVLMAADLTVMPGAIGLLVMHSMAYGTPVISHNNFDNQGPENEAIVEGITGGFFEEGSVESLAQAIEHWVSNPEKLTAGKAEAISMIDKFYNPQSQRNRIDFAVSGKPSIDNGSGL